MRITALTFLALVASTDASQAAVCAPGTYVSTASPPPRIFLHRDFSLALGVEKCGTYVRRVFLVIKFL